MWKWIGILGLFILGIWGFNAYTGSQQAHPVPEVTADGETLEVRKGSYCWNGLRSAICEDMGFTSAFEMGDREKAPALSPDDVIHFRFDREPLPGTLTAKLWSSMEQSTPIDFQDGTISVPDQEGYYVIHLSARWEQGDGNYGFGFYITNSYEETGEVIPFTQPPALTVQVGDEARVIDAGTSDWTYTDPSGETVSESGIALPRDDVVASLQPLPVQSNDEITFEFGLDPVTTDLAVWEADGSDLPISENPDLSEFEGVTVFELTATWEQGNGQYVFALDVRN